MGRYVIVSNVLFRGTILRPGEIHTLPFSEEMERILLDRGCIQPAGIPATPELEELKGEMTHGADDRADIGEGLLPQPQLRRHQRKLKQG
jgi:hypothetical protein